MEIIYAVIAIVAMIIVLRILSLPVRIIKWLVANGVTGVILLYLVNFIGAGFGLNIELNIVNTLVAGVLGIPGIILLLLLK